MPVYKDTERGTWFVKCSYTDYTGTRRQKKKRGFKLQREAKEWERAFLERQQGSPSMLFEDFVEIYLEDARHRLRETTVISQENIIRCNILPYLGKRRLNEIAPADIRKWQNELKELQNRHGAPYKPGTLYRIHSVASTVFNFAVKYYNLPSNPCRTAGSMGTIRGREMDFWTIDEYKQFIAVIEDPQYHAIFQTLYYTGLRIGELLALTPADLDLDACTLTVSKSYQRIKRQDVITAPKTPKGNRTITIPPGLRDELKEYMGRLYGLAPDDRLFPLQRQIVKVAMEKYIETSGVKRIRLHDLRHSHASLLIELDFPPLLIAERLGHENIQTTLNIYSHLYPGKQEDVAARLQELI